MNIIVIILIIAGAIFMLGSGFGKYRKAKQLSDVPLKTRISFLVGFTSWFVAIVLGNVFSLSNDPFIVKILGPLLFLAVLWGYITAARKKKMPILAHVIIIPALIMFAFVLIGFLLK